MIKNAQWHPFPLIFHSLRARMRTFVISVALQRFPVWRISFGGCYHYSHNKLHPLTPTGNIKSELRLNVIHSKSPVALRCVQKDQGSLESSLFSQQVKSLETERCGWELGSGFWSTVMPECDVKKTRVQPCHTDTHIFVHLSPPFGRSWQLFASCCLLLPESTCDPCFTKEGKYQQQDPNTELATAAKNLPPPALTDLHPYIPAAGMPNQWRFLINHLTLSSLA